jgi:hypothetical protein
VKTLAVSLVPAATVAVASIVVEVPIKVEANVMMRAVTALHQLSA